MEWNPIKENGVLKQQTQNVDSHTWRLIKSRLLRAKDNCFEISAGSLMDFEALNSSRTRLKVYDLEKKNNRDFGTKTELFYLKTPS